MPVTDAQLEAYEENAALNAVYLDTVESVAKKIIAEMKINSDYGDSDKVFSEYMGRVRGTIKGAKGPALQKIDDAVHNDESVENAQNAFRSTYKKYFPDVKRALILSTEPTLTPDKYETLPPKLQEKYKKTDIPAGKGDDGKGVLANYPAHIIYRRKNQIGNQSGGRRTRNRKNKRKTTRRR